MAIRSQTSRISWLQPWKRTASLALAATALISLTAFSAAQAPAATTTTATTTTATTTTATSTAPTAEATVAGSTATGEAPAGVTMSGIELWNGGGCFGCHGDVAAGGGDPANPSGPSLRRRLKHEVLVEAITCGRPGAGMPAFLKGAYTEVACKEMPVGTVPDNVIAMDLFTPEEIEALVAWLEENVVGQKVTRENCALFYEGNQNAPGCMQY